MLIVLLFGLLILLFIGEIHEHILYRQMPCYVSYTTV